MLPREDRAPFVQKTHRLGLKIDVSNVAEALEVLEGSAARRSILVDANILLYAADETSPFHGRVREWLEVSLNGPTRVAIP